MLHYTDNHFVYADVRKHTHAPNHFSLLSNVIYLAPRRRWVDNIRMDLREIGWDGMDWMDLAQDRDQWRALVNTVMNLRVP
jgi:hypothetical protein